MDNDNIDNVSGLNLTVSASLTVAGAGIVTPAAVRTTFDTILP